MGNGGGGVSSHPVGDLSSGCTKPGSEAYRRVLIGPGWYLSMPQFVMTMGLAGT